MNFTLPPTATSDISAGITEVLASLAPLVVLLCGLILAFFFIEKLITILTKKNEK